MASSAAGSKPAFFLLLVVVVALTAGAGVTSAATFIVANLCPFPGWLFTVPAGTTGGRIWGRTDCNFTAGDHGRCATGDCAGALHCELSGKPPATLAEFTLGGGGGGAEDDFYDISVADGFNLPMSFVCDDRSGRDATPIRCMGPGCAGEVRTCKADRVYHYHQYFVIFCPNA
ncbi:unnamed protein product [Urochloa decumbens]|uniref:Thaumatin-like protein n=1 Tax=Urochloa decumbens TaxID=240449 RepID=A0ABC8WYQ8_9POAL